MEPSNHVLDVGSQVLRDVAMATIFWLSMGYNFCCNIDTLFDSRGGPLAGGQTGPPGWDQPNMRSSPLDRDSRNHADQIWFSFLAERNALSTSTCI